MAIRLRLGSERVSDLVVAEEAAVGLREDHAVHQARVRVLVGHTEVARAHESGDDPDVDAVAGGKEQDRLLLLERGQPLGELVVDFERSAQDGRARGTVTVAVRGLDDGLLDLRAVRQSEVVVGGEVEEVGEDLVGLRVADVDAGAGLSLHGKPIEVVARRLGVLPPLIERIEHAEGVVARPEVEVRVVVLHGQGELLARSIGKHPNLPCSVPALITHASSPSEAMSKPASLYMSLLRRP